MKPAAAAVCEQAAEVHVSQQDNALREKFLFTLEWLLAVTKRYTDHIQFGLIHVNFANYQVLGDMFGAQEAAQKLEEVLLCLRKAFRRTDLVARDGVDFWILAPYTETDGRLADKVRNIIEIASQSGLEIVEHDISIFSLPIDVGELDENSSATEFLAHLKKNHISLASHTISCPPKQPV